MRPTRTTSTVAGLAALFAACGGGSHTPDGGADARLDGGVDSAADASVDGGTADAGDDTVDIRAALAAALERANLVNSRVCPCNEEFFLGHESEEACQAEAPRFIACLEAAFPDPSRAPAADGRATLCQLAATEGYPECLGADFTCDDETRFQDCAVPVENALVMCPGVSMDLEDSINDCLFGS